MIVRGDDDLPEDLRSLDRRLREEFRTEAREVEALVTESELRARTLEDVVLELINRGDRIQVGTPKRTFNGTLIYVGKDFCTIQDPESMIDVNLALPSYIKVTERAQQGGQERGEGPGTLEMRLVEHKDEFAEVELHTAALEEPLTGRITTIGQDHVVLTDRSKEQWVFPLTTVTFVVCRPRIR